MFTCPNCQTVLSRAKNKFGLFWICPSCKGRAATLEVIRKIIPRPVINKLWHRALSGDFLQKRNCPSCAHPMSEIPITNTEHTVYLDVCPKCHMVWFDNTEYQQLPKIPVEAKLEEKLSPEQREKLALAKLEIYKEQQEAENTVSDGPDDWIELLFGILGFPVEYDEEGLTQKPVITWILSGLIAVISIAAFFNLKEIINNWGLVPEYFYRYFGLTFISSFFLHGGAFHLISNLYFLLIFGDNVEDFLGKYRFLLLIFLAAIIGNVAHILGDVHSLTPCIGASGGISGILTYYVLRFPHNHVGFFMGYRWYFLKWIRLPVTVMLAGWILLQFFGVYEQLAGFSDISAIAHLGGAAVGFIFWLVTRPKLSEINQSS